MIVTLSNISKQYCSAKDLIAAIEIFNYMFTYIFKRRSEQASILSCTPCRLPAKTEKQEALGRSGLHGGGKAG